MTLSFTGQRVTVRAKVMYVAEACHVGADRFHKQDVTVADETGSCLITLWQDKVGSMIKDKAYHFRNISVTLFNKRLQLTIPREGAVTQDEQDLVNASAVTVNDDTEILRMTSVAAVNGLTEYRGCLNCRNESAPTNPTTLLKHISPSL